MAKPVTTPKELAEEFRRLAEGFWLESEGKGFDYKLGLSEGQAKAYMQAAQMVDKLGTSTDPGSAFTNEDESQ